MPEVVGSAFNAGNHLGADALLHDHPHGETATATSRVTLPAVPRGDFLTAIGSFCAPRRSLQPNEEDAAQA